MREGLVLELRAIRRGDGDYALRLAHLPWLIDCLGYGSLEQAANQLQELRDQYGTDPTTPIGAFFWLANLGLEDTPRALEKRQEAYGKKFACEARTALRRSDRGIEALAALARDLTEEHRPVGMFWLFQGATATVVIDFWMTRESYREPIVSVNDGVIERPDFILHRDGEQTWGDRYRHRLILDDLPLLETTGAYDSALTVRTVWDMPIRPTWQVTGQIPDPRYAVRLTVLSHRASEVCLLALEPTPASRPR